MEAGRAAARPPRPLLRRTLPGIAAHAWLAVATLVPAQPVAAEEIRISEGTNLSIDVAPDGTLAMDLLGGLWLVPAHGGDAERLTDGLTTVRRPRFSPDGSEILFQGESSSGPELWRYALESGEHARVGDGIGQHGDWHPDGERIVFSAERDGSGLDLWERDLATGVEWRLTSHGGDETAPAWSANGRHLAYVLHDGDRWRLMLRRFGLRPASLLESPTPLHAPSWRPDGTLITYLRSTDAGLEVRMLILAQPPLDRSLIAGEDFFVTPVSWKDRGRLYYAADGSIKTRGFEAWQSRRVHFSAAVERPDARPDESRRGRPLPDTDAPAAQWVVRAARLYDGHDGAYRRDVDVVIDGGTIAAVEERRDRGDRFVLDLGDVTVMPGLIDVYSAMPTRPAAEAGPLMLAFGVTTVVTPDVPAGFDETAWRSGEPPGPRLLRATSATGDAPANVEPELRLAVIAEDAAAGDALLREVRRWQRRGVPVLAKNGNVGLKVGADLSLGGIAMPASPAGRRYEDARLLAGNGPLTFVSGLADRGTPGLAELRRSRQGRAFDGAADAARGFAALPMLGGNGATLVVGSRPSGLPAGLATQAELRALQAAGVPPARALHAATGAAARLLGLDGQLGAIVAGAHADLVLVAGDPLANAGDALNVIGVVRAGRFFSLSTLLERAGVE